MKSLTASTTSLPAEIPQTTIYTPLICQSLFHLSTNGLHHRLISSPGPSPQELIALNRTIDEWGLSTPTYFKLELPDIQSNETFLFAHYRLSWRTWNLKILLSRPVILQWAARLKSTDTSGKPDKSDESECRRVCTESASATINSISDFMSKGVVSRLSTWYLLCVSLPVASLLSKTSVSDETSQADTFFSKPVWFP
jgi:transcriptional regulatory protein GAL4